MIGIYTLYVSTEMIDFAKTGLYRAVPMIVYKVNDEKPQHFIIKRPIEIFKENMEYRQIRNIVHETADPNITFLSIPSKAFSKMQSYAKQNIDKVIADMITHIVVKLIHQMQSEDTSSRNVFFIENIDSNKVIGRLGYLYLDSKVNTIAFVTYKTGGLLTDILNGDNERLKFDINYFNSQEKSKEIHSEIIPNDYMESMTQTVFFRIPDTEATLSPLRFDVLSQGISKEMIREKVNIIEDILQNRDNLTLPIIEKSTHGHGVNITMIPRVLNECIEAAEKYKHEAQVILEGELYG